MKRYDTPELVFEALEVEDVLTVSGGTVATTTGPTTATDPTRATDPTAPTEPAQAGGGIVLPEDTFG